MASASASAGAAALALVALAIGRFATDADAAPGIAEGGVDVTATDAQLADGARDSARPLPLTKSRPCWFEMTGGVTASGPCVIDEINTEMRFVPHEYTRIRITASSPKLRLSVSFLDRPPLGPQRDSDDGGALSWVSASITVEATGARWEGMQHVEPFTVTVTSVRAEHPDATPAFYDIHGTVTGSVAANLAGPSLPPVKLRVTF